MKKKQQRRVVETGWMYNDGQRWLRAVPWRCASVANGWPVVCCSFVDRYFDVPKDSELQLVLTNFDPKRVNAVKARVQLRRKYRILQGSSVSIFQLWNILTFTDMGNHDMYDYADKLLDGLFPEAKERSRHTLWVRAYYREKS